MSYSVFILLTLAFALANGKPAESATAEENLNEPVKSRDSRQMMLPAHAPYYYVPYRPYYQPQHQQPSMAQNFDYLSDLIRSLDPDTKERLISTLMTLADKFQQGNQPLDLSGFKSHFNELPADLLSAFLDEEGQLPAEFQNASPEQIKDLVESRLAFGEIAGSVASVLVSYIVQAIIAALFPSTPSTQSPCTSCGTLPPGLPWVNIPTTSQNDTTFP